MRRRWVVLRSVLWMCDMICRLFQYVDAWPDGPVQRPYRSDCSNTAVRCFMEDVEVWRKLVAPKWAWRVSAEGAFNLSQIINTSSTSTTAPDRAFCFRITIGLTLGATWCNDKTILGSGNIDVLTILTQHG